MKNKHLILKILGWSVLLLGMAMFLFTKETTLIDRVIAVSCCIVAFVLFRLERNIKN